jgi:hypothetical protein
MSPQDPIQGSQYLSALSDVENASSMSKVSAEAAAIVSLLIILNKKLRDDVIAEYLPESLALCFPCTDVH